MSVEVKTWKPAEGCKSCKDAQRIMHDHVQISAHSNALAIKKIREQEAISRNLYEFMHEAVRHCWMGKIWTPQQILEKGVELGLMIKKEECVYAYADEIKKHFGQCS